MRLLLLAAAALGIMSTAAFSADLIIEEPEIAPVVVSHDWSGGYIGLFAGYGWGETVHADQIPLPEASTGPLAIDGWQVGLTAGANMQMDAFVLGIEGDVAWANISGSHGPAVFETFNCGTGPCETEVNWLATLRGRIGFAADTFMPYLTAGLAVGGVDARIPNDPNLQFGEHTQFGWTAGAGVEVALDDNWSVKGEYLYTDLGEWFYDESQDEFSATATFSTVKLGLNYSF